MKILFFSQYFWPEYFPINHVAQKLSQSKHRVDVLTGKPNYPLGKFFKGYKAYGLENEKWGRINIFRVPISSRGRNSYISLSINYLSFILSAFLFSPFVLRKRRYDCIIVYGLSPIFQVLPAIFISRLKKVPIILWVQDLWPESLEHTGLLKIKFFKKIIECLVKISYSGVDLILVQSKAFIKPVSNYSKSKKILYLPNTVDEIFYPNHKNTATTHKVEALSKGFSVLFAGNLGSAQGLGCILDAAEKLLKHKEIRFVFIGEGRLKEFLTEEKIKRKLTNVYIEGSYPINLMPGILSQASSLLVSLTNHPIINLTIPSKLQAYLASGKPIIGCISGEAAKIIKASNSGYICEPGDSYNLAKIVLDLYSTSSQGRKKMGISGQAYFKNNFSSDMVVGQMIKYINSIETK